jgi:hypothetical protein
MAQSVAIRLATDGKAQVKTDLTEIGDVGDAQAKRWSRAYERAGDDVSAAMARQAAAAQKLAAITPQTATQQIFQAGASTNFTGSSARESAIALKELLDEQDRLAAGAAALKARIDPLSVAQAKYDAEVKNANELLAANAISESQRDAAVALSQKTLRQATQAVQGHSNALGFNRMQFLIAEGAAHRYVDSILAGMSPMRAFMMQAGDVGNILAMDDNGVAGGLTKVRGLLNPTTIGIAALTAAVIVGGAAWYSYEAAIAKLDALSMGAGRVLGESGAELEANAEAAASAGDITVKAARDIEASYLQIAKSGDVLVGLTAITQDFAAATGQDAKSATQELGAAFTDPIQGAQDLAEKYGYLTQAQIDHIAKLEEEGKLSQAQAELLGDVASAVKGAADQVTGLAWAWKTAGTWASNALSAMGKGLSQGTSWFVRSLGSEGRPVPWDTSTPHADNGAAANQARARAQALADQYTGAAQLDGIRRTVGTLRAGIAAGGNAEQVAQWTQALNANQHALQTWIPAADKANKLSELDAKIAAAKTPAQRQALATEKERLQLAGTVITSQDAETRATEAGNRALASATHHSGAHAASLARQADSMAVAAKASLDLADAYLKGDSAAVEAEARRKAATDATRKGIDVAAQTQRQLNLDVAQGVANGAKSVAQLRDETAARQAVNDNVSAGTLAASKMDQALSDEAALRPLLTLRTVAHGDALTELNKVIDAYTAALKAAHAEEARSGAEQAIEDAKRQALDLRAAIGDLGKTPQQQSLDAARRAAGHRADDENYTGKDRTDFINSQVDAARAQNEGAAARFADQQRRSMADTVQLQETQIGLVGKSADEQDRVLSRLQLQQTLANTLGDYYGEYAPAILKAADAIDANNIKLKAINDNWQELNQFGDQFLSDVLNPQDWTSWGDFGKRVLGDIEEEFIKLAALNPLKNMLFGESNPTLGSIGGLLGKLGGLFGGGGTTMSSMLSDIGTWGAGHNAAGTENWSGGLTWVNENGPEIADLPSGTRIYPASMARQMANDNAQPMHLTLSLVTDSEMFDLRVAQVSDSRIQLASPKIAAGGAIIAGKKAKHMANNRLGKRAA